MLRLITLTLLAVLLVAAPLLLLHIKSDLWQKSAAIGLAIITWFVGFYMGGMFIIMTKRKERKIPYAKQFLAKFYSRN